MAWLCYTITSSHKPTPFSGSLFPWPSTRSTKHLPLTLQAHRSKCGHHLWCLTQVVQKCKCIWWPSEVRLSTELRQPLCSWVKARTDVSHLRGCRNTSSEGGLEGGKIKTKKQIHPLFLMLRRFYSHRSKGACDKTLPWQVLPKECSEG